MLNSFGVLSNSTWLVADKIFRLSLGAIIWIWLARQVGPEEFGKWNFAISFTAFFAVIAGLGFDGIVQRELIAAPERASELLGTAVVLRLFAGAVSFTICVTAAWFARREEPLVVALVALNAAVFVLQTSQVVDYLFQARMQNRHSVVALNAAFLVASSIRLGLLWKEASLIWFGVTLVVEAVLAAAFLLKSAQRSTASLMRWNFNQATARRLLSESWPMLLSGMAVIVYMRIDQVMLASMVGDAAVGQFSAALRLSEIWYFVPAAILSAAFPKLLARRQQEKAAYERCVQALYDAMAWLGLAVALAISIAAPWLVENLYGAAYREAAYVLQVQIWAVIIVSMSYVHSRWLLAEGLQRFGLLYTLAGCAINLSLNTLLIPRYGALGAAWSTLAAQFLPVTLQLVFPETRQNFFMMLKTVGAPIRYWRRWLL